MQHAFLIEAHNNWWQLKQLIAALDAENHDVYVHIDKKSVDFDKADFSSVAHKSNVSFFQTYSVYWGGTPKCRSSCFCLKRHINGNTIIIT